MTMLAFNAALVCNRRRLNSQWNSPTCCLYNTAYRMPVNALATSGARAPAGMILTKQAGMSLASEELIQFNESKTCTDTKYIAMQWAVIMDVA